MKKLLKIVSGLLIVAALVFTYALVCNVEAIQLYMKILQFGAEHGNAYAQYELGSLNYFARPIRQNGKIVYVRDLNETVKWYSAAASNGNVHAEYNLGNIYAKGDGLPKNNVEALKWFLRANNHGLLQATAAITYMKQQMTPSEIADAKSKAQNGM